MGQTITGLTQSRPRTNSCSMKAHVPMRDRSMLPGVADPVFHIAHRNGQYAGAMSATQCSQSIVACCTAVDFGLRTEAMCCQCPGSISLLGGGKRDSAQPRATLIRSRHWKRASHRTGIVPCRSYLGRPVMCVPMCLLCTDLPIPRNATSLNGCECQKSISGSTYPIR